MKLSSLRANALRLHPSSWPRQGAPLADRWRPLCSIDSGTFSTTTNAVYISQFFQCSLLPDPPHFSVPEWWRRRLPNSKILPLSSLSHSCSFNTQMAPKMAVLVHPRNYPKQQQKRNMKKNSRKKEQRNTLGKAHKIKKKNINSSICENKIVLTISSSSTPTPPFPGIPQHFSIWGILNLSIPTLSSFWQHCCTVESRDLQLFFYCFFFCRLFLIFPTLRSVVVVVSSTWPFHHHIRYGVRVREKEQIFGKFCRVAGSGLVARISIY